MALVEFCETLICCIFNIIQLEYLISTVVSLLIQGLLNTHGNFLVIFLLLISILIPLQSESILFV